MTLPRLTKVLERFDAGQMRKESLSVDGSEQLEDPKRANTASAE